MDKIHLSERYIELVAVIRELSNSPFYLKYLTKGHKSLMTHCFDFSDLKNTLTDALGQCF